MIDKNKMVSVTNRSNGRVLYSLKDSGVHRAFTGGETKQISFDELEKLSWEEGGRALLKNSLVIQDEEVAAELLGDIEPEYFYTKEIIDKLLTEGTLDQLKDTLEFGPKGVQDLVKEEAVNIKVNNVAMRDEIKKQTNFDVSRAIELNKDDEISSTAAASGKRRSAPIAATNLKSDTSSVGSNYKIVK